MEVVDDRARKLGQGRFSTDHAGYTALLAYVRVWQPGCKRSRAPNDARRSLAQRPLEDGEVRVDVPAFRRSGPAVRDQPQPRERRTGRALDRGRGAAHQGASGAQGRWKEQALRLLVDRRDAEPASRPMREPQQSLMAVTGIGTGTRSTSIWHGAPTRTAASSAVTVAVASSRSGQSKSPLMLMTMKESTTPQSANRSSGWGWVTWLVPAGPACAQWLMTSLRPVEENVHRFRQSQRHAMLQYHRLARCQPPLPTLIRDHLRAVGAIRVHGQDLPLVDLQLHMLP